VLLPAVNSVLASPSNIVMHGAVLPAGLEEAYISYEVTTVTSLPHFSSSRCSVRRRFRDFVSLSNLLPKLLHGRCEAGTVVHTLQHSIASRHASACDGASLNRSRSSQQLSPALRCMCYCEVCLLA
jgi:hypothetical protein